MMGFRAVLAIAERDVKSTLKDKMALFWLIAFPIFMLTMSFLMWANPMPPVTLKVGVVCLDSTADWGNLTFTAHNVTEIMAQVNVTTEDGEVVKVFQLTDYGNDTDAALADLKGGKLDAVVVFPDRFSYNMSYGFTANVDIYVRGGDAYREQVATAILTRFFEELSDRTAQARIEAAEHHMPPQAPPQLGDWMRGLAWPVNATVHTVVPEALVGKAGLRGWFSIAMAGVEFLIAGMSIGAVMIVEERDKKTLRRLLAAPIGPWDLLIGKTLSGLLWLAISALVCVLYGLAWGARISWDPLANPAHALVPVLMLLGALTSVGMGLIISMAARTAKGASGLATAISWPLMFITGIWLPKWMLPEPLRALADYFPLTMAIDAIRDVMVFGKGMEAVLPVLPWLAGMAVLIYGLGALAYKLVLRRSL